MMDKKIVQNVHTDKYDYTIYSDGTIKGHQYFYIGGERMSIPIETTVRQMQQAQINMDNKQSCERLPNEDEVMVPIGSTTEKDLILRAAGWKKGNKYFNLQHKAIMQGYNNIIMPKKDYEEALQFIEERERQMRILAETAETNNAAIALEKKGDIDGAIELYEKNIERGYPATHSYDRLMILYRKKSDYTNEIRVIKKAIKIFSDKNRRSAKQAIKAHPELAERINAALETCEGVKHTGGMYVFNPYPVTKYKKRLEKAEKLSKKE